MSTPDSTFGRVTGLLARSAFFGSREQLLVDEAPKYQMAEQLRPSRAYHAAEVWRISAPKQEQLFVGGCLVMFWLISAASLSGYIILASFVIIALARYAKNTCLGLAEKLPRRSRSRQCLIALVSAAFFSLLIFRACYIATVIVDAQFR